MESVFDGHLSEDESEEMGDKFPRGGYDEKFDTDASIARSFGATLGFEDLYSILEIDPKKHNRKNTKDRPQKMDIEEYQKFKAAKRNLSSLRKKARMKSSNLTRRTPRAPMEPKPEFQFPSPRKPKIVASKTPTSGVEKDELNFDDILAKEKKKTL